jgi:hypothetical protein
MRGTSAAITPEATMKLFHVLGVLKTAHDCDSAREDTRPVRVLRVLRVLRTDQDHTQVRARVVCRDGKVRDVAVTVARLTDPADTFATFEAGA